MIQNAREAIDWYDNLDPRSLANPNQLLAAYAALEAEPRHTASMRVASLALELSINNATHKKPRSFFGQDARQRFMMTDENGDWVLQDPKAALIRTHLDLLNPLQPAVSKSRRDSLALIERLRDARADVSAGFGANLRGAAAELAISVLLNEPKDGLAAYPSLPRQDSNGYSVDGKAYRWDLSIESNGKRARSGVYRAQVKGVYDPEATSVHGKPNTQYHPDIVVIPTAEVFDHTEQVFMVPDWIRRPNAHNSMLLDNARDRILGLLNIHGPTTRGRRMLT